MFSICSDDFMDLSQWSICTTQKPNEITLVSCNKPNFTMYILNDNRVPMSLLNLGLSSLYQNKLNSALNLTKYVVPKTLNEPVRALKKQTLQLICTCISNIKKFIILTLGGGNCRQQVHLRQIFISWQYQGNLTKGKGSVHLTSLSQLIQVSCVIVALDRWLDGLNLLLVHDVCLKLSCLERS